MNNLYQALYRTYRPKTFKDVIGQEVVTKTLRNALEHHKTAQAYLFSGPRGTGKTSIARIFAKALNCANTVQGNPCGECEVCQSITDGMNPDVIEIDAASNNGVEQIRDIRDKVKYLPTSLKYKVYIIDEVHMLTTGAFNALLKTLEEPPAHVVFIMATTEIQKVPATILSRCQNFDFKPLATPEIMQGLKHVALTEQINISDDALANIAESAEGGMRDALSYLDQVRSYGNDTITLNDVNAVTGNLDYTHQISLASFIHEHNITAAIDTTHELLDSGKEAAKVVTNMIEFYRDMMMYKSLDAVKESHHKLYRYIYAQPQYNELALTITQDEIYYNIDVLNNALNKIKYTQNPTLYLEIALMKMSSVNESDFDLFAKYNALERKLQAITDNGNGVITVSGDNSEQLDQINARITKITTELTRLELPKLCNRVTALENNHQNVNNASVNSALEERVATLEHNQSELNTKITGDLEARLQSLNDKVSLVQNNNDLSQKVTSLEKDLNDYVKDTQSRLDSLEENTGIDFTDEETIDESERLNQIDSRLASLEIRVQEESHDKEEAWEARLSHLEENASDNLINRIEVLEDMVNSLISKGTSSEAEEPIFQLGDDEDDDMYHVLLSRVDNLTTRITKLENNPELDKIYQKMTILEQETINAALPLDNALVENRLKELEEKIKNNNDIAEKVAYLENKVYSILAGEATKKKPTVKETPVKAEPLFNDEILGGKRSSFEGLKQTQTELEKETQAIASEALESDVESITEGDVKIEVEENAFETPVNSDINVNNESLTSTQEEAIDNTKEQSGITLDNAAEDVLESDVESFTEGDVKLDVEENGFETPVNSDINANNEALTPAQEEAIDNTKEQSGITLDNTAEDVLESDVESFTEGDVKLDVEENAFETSVNSNLNASNILEANDTNSVSEIVTVSNETPASEAVTPEPPLPETPLDQKLETNNELYTYTTDSDKIVVKEKSALAIKIEKPAEEEDESIDEFSRFSVKVIERILNNALKTECKEDKKRIEEIWSTRLSDVRDKDEQLVATFFSRGKIAAVGDHEFILVYATAVACNQTMAPKFKKKALAYLTYILGGEYNYMSLPEKDWLDKRSEYVEQYSMGFKEPKLTPIKNPALKVMANTDNQDANAKKAQELFGNIVKIK